MPVWSKLAVLGAVVVLGAVYARPDAPAAGPAGFVMPAAAGDGDSWRDTEGQEYRLGLVNTPEIDECFGPEATAERQRRTRGGFRAEAYATDRYGRDVSVVTLPDGRNLNVHLARQGYADDRYLDDFRAENPELAEELEAAFAEARRDGRGLWGACRNP